MLLQQLANENANADCQAALAGIRTQNKNVASYIRACQNVRTETHRAQALAALMRSASAVTCFKCGKPGHGQRECCQPNKGGQGSPPQKLT